MSRDAARNRSSQRTTRQKRAIVGCLAANRGKHLTAESLFDLLRRVGTPVGQATVYRVLKTLENEGTVSKYFIPEGTGACYQYIGDTPDCNRHCHLVCEKCGVVIHMGSDALGAFVAEARGQSGFAVDEFRLAFYGLCKMCGNASDKGKGAATAKQKGNK